MSRRRRRSAPQPPPPPPPVEIEVPQAESFAAFDGARSLVAQVFAVLSTSVKPQWNQLADAMEGLEGRRWDAIADRVLEANDQLNVLIRAVEKTIGLLDPIDVEGPPPRSREDEAES